MNDARHEALLYERESNDSVRCNLCPHYCHIKNGRLGLCGVRKNEDGTLYTLVNGETTSQNADPIEKKPFFHADPGSLSLSISTVGCNMKCPYCINWQISQARKQLPMFPKVASTPKDIAENALRAGCRSISYTYTEPTVFFEYMEAIASEANRVGLSNFLKTNGFISKEALNCITPWTTGVNVDLKSFRPETYREFGGALEPVLQSLEFFHQAGVWIEVSTVVIPGVNDSSVELKEMATFIAQHIGPLTPWHVIRFFPAFQMNDRPPTPVETLYQARRIGWEAGLKFVYLGNLLVDGGQDSHCAVCDRLLIQRRGGMLQRNLLVAGHCPDCCTPFPGIGSANAIPPLSKQDSLPRR